MSNLVVHVNLVGIMREIELSRKEDRYWPKIDTGFGFAKYFGSGWWAYIRKKNDSSVSISVAHSNLFALTIFPKCHCFYNVVCIFLYYHCHSDSLASFNSQAQRLLWVWRKCLWGHSALIKNYECTIVFRVRFLS